MHPCIDIGTCTFKYIKQQYLVLEVSVKSGIGAALDCRLGCRQIKHIVHNITMCLICLSNYIFAWFFEITFNVRMCVCACMPPRPSITSGVI